MVVIWRKHIDIFSVSESFSVQSIETFVESLISLQNIVMAQKHLMSLFKMCVDLAIYIRLLKQSGYSEWRL